MQHDMPEEIRLQKSPSALVLSYAQEQFTLPAEFLRVYSPSAEVRGHAPGQEVLQHGKESVQIAGVEPIGHYALKLNFDDGHDSGIYDWDYLYSLCQAYDTMWTDYLDRLDRAGLQRKA